MKEKLPLAIAIRWILISTLVVSGTSMLAWIYYYNVRQKRISDEAFKIVAIVQDSQGRESLNTAYLAELLELSLDKPTNLYRFNINEGTKKLLNSPLIKEASITKVKPGALYISYTLRKPIAFLGDYQDIALDEKGFVFPFSPFFTPKNLPIVYLGLAPWGKPEDDLHDHGASWGKPLEGKKIGLALEILQTIESEFKDLNLIKIDVSNAFSASYGQREIIIAIEELEERSEDHHKILTITPRLLRLDSKNYRLGLEEYQTLRKEVAGIYYSKNDLQKVPEEVVDLRVQRIALIKENLGKHH
jgi:hypothetical protein